MAIKTNFSIDDFKNILLSYDLGEFLSADPITTGTVQTNFFLNTTKTKLVLRYYENRSIESVSFEINLINFLSKKRYPCPSPFRNYKGEYIGIFRDKPFVLFEFVEGEHIENPSEEQKKQLIKKVAELHSLTVGYKPKLLQYRLNYNVEQCNKLAQEKAKKINSLNAWEKLKWHTTMLSQLILPTSLPKGICHSDFHFSNVFYHNGRFNSLIDFDDANYTFLLFDLVCLMEPFKTTFERVTWDTFCMEDDVFDFNQARKVICEYSKHRPLSYTEKLHIFDVLKLSILIDCIWYFERGDVTDFFEKRKIDYLTKLGREEFYRRLFL